MTTPLVVGVDGSGGSLRAVVWAAREAGLRGCPLRLVHVLPRWEDDLPYVPPGKPSARARGMGITDEAAAIAREAHPLVDVTVALATGPPTTALLHESREAELLVLGIQGEGGTGNLPLGSVSLQVVGHAACPVVVVGRIPMDHDRIAVGFDGSDDSGTALAYAFEEASVRGCELRVLHAWSMPLPQEPEDVLDVGPDELAAVRRQGLEERLSALRGRHPGVRLAVDMVRCAPVPALFAASGSADLLIVGSRGRGGFHGLALGSVTHALLHQSACPVAVVRPRSRGDSG